MDDFAKRKLASCPARGACPSALGMQALQHKLCLSLAPASSGLRLQACKDLYIINYLN